MFRKKIVYFFEKIAITTIDNERTRPDHLIDMTTEIHARAITAHGQRNYALRHFNPVALETRVKAGEFEATYPEINAIPESTLQDGPFGETKLRLWESLKSQNWEKFLEYAARLSQEGYQISLFPGKETALPSWHLQQTGIHIPHNINLLEDVSNFIQLPENLYPANRYDVLGFIYSMTLPSPFENLKETRIVLSRLDEASRQMETTVINPSFYTGLSLYKGLGLNLPMTARSYEEQTPFITSVMDIHTIPTRYNATFYLNKLYTGSYASLNIVEDDGRYIARKTAQKHVDSTQGSGYDKLREEVAWIMNLPDDMRDFFPKIWNYHDDGEIITVDYQFYPWLNVRDEGMYGGLNDFYKFAEQAPEQSAKQLWELMVSLYQNLSTTFYQHQVEKTPENFFERFHGSKIRDRLKETVRRHSELQPIIDADVLFIDGKKQVGALALVDLIAEVQNKTGLLNPPEGLVHTHGDFNTGNILCNPADVSKDSGHLRVKLVDDRGWIDLKTKNFKGQDPMYDFAKAAYHFYGHLDLIRTRAYLVDLELLAGGPEGTLNFKLPKDLNNLHAFHRIYQHLPAEVITFLARENDFFGMEEKGPLWKLRFLFTLASAMTSDVPFALEDNQQFQVRAVTKYIQGTYFLNLFWEELIKYLEVEFPELGKEMSNKFQAILNTNPAPSQADTHTIRETTYQPLRQWFDDWKWFRQHDIPEDDAYALASDLFDLRRAIAAENCACKLQKLFIDMHANNRTMYMFDVFQRMEDSDPAFKPGNIAYEYMEQKILLNSDFRPFIQEKAGMSPELLYPEILLLKGMVSHQKNHHHWQNEKIDNNWTALMTQIGATENPAIQGIMQAILLMDEVAVNLSPDRTTITFTGIPDVIITTQGFEVAPQILKNAQTLQRGIFFFDLHGNLSTRDDDIDTEIITELYEMLMLGVPFSFSTGHVASEPEKRVQGFAEFFKSRIDVYYDQGMKHHHYQDRAYVDDPDYTEYVGRLTGNDLNESIIPGFSNYLLENFVHTWEPFLINTARYLNQFIEFKNYPTPENTRQALAQLHHKFGVSQFSEERLNSIARQLLPGEDQAIDKLINQIVLILNHAKNVYEQYEGIQQLRQGTLSESDMHTFNQMVAVAEMLRVLHSCAAHDAEEQLYMETKFIALDENQLPVKDGQLGFKKESGGHLSFSAVRPNLIRYIYGDYFRTQLDKHPEYAQIKINLGGTTTFEFDLAPNGTIIDKATPIQYLSEKKGIPLDLVFFSGDEFSFQEMPPSWFRGIDAPAADLQNTHPGMTVVNTSPNQHSARAWPHMIWSHDSALTSGTIGPQASLLILQFYRQHLEDQMKALLKGDLVDPRPVMLDLKNALAAPPI